MQRKIALFLFILFYPLVTYSQSLESSYRTFKGDFNGDSRTDIFVQHIGLLPVPLGSNLQIFYPGKRASFLLIQNADKSFSIQSNLSTSQRRTLSQWPASGLVIAVSDINLDDAFDLVIKNVASVVPGALDQIVYARPGAGMPPLSVKPITNEFRSFFEQVYNFIVNPNYYVENAQYRLITTPQIYNLVQNQVDAIISGYACTAVTGKNCAAEFVNIAYWLPANAGLNCFNVATDFYIKGDSLGFDSLDDAVNTICGPDLAWVIYVNEPYIRADLSAFNQEAVSIAQSLNATFGNGGVVAQSTDAKVIDSILKKVLGTTVLNGVLASGGISASESSGIVVSPGEMAEDGNVFDSSVLEELNAIRMLRILFELINIRVAVLATPANIFDRFDINHYTGQLGFEGIPQSRTVRKSGDGYAYFTNDVYLFGSHAKARLSLESTPIGFYIFNEDEIPVLIGPPSEVLPHYGELGGGTERKYFGDVPVGPPPYRWVKIR